jgi:hypothetical protein
MGVTDSWVAGCEAVLAFERFCLDQKWAWHEVPGHADFGKGGYVDIVEVTGAVTEIAAQRVAAIVASRRTQSS